MGAASNGDLDDKSPLVNIAFSELVNSPPIEDEIIKALGGRGEIMISGIYFNLDPKRFKPF